jgi:hypothetical protein
MDVNGKVALGLGRQEQAVSFGDVGGGQAVGSGDVDASCYSRFHPRYIMMALT